MPTVCSCHGPQGLWSRREKCRRRQRSEFMGSPAADHARACNTGCRSARIIEKNGSLSHACAAIGRPSVQPGDCSQCPAILAAACCLSAFRKQVPVNVRDDSNPGHSIRPGCHALRPKKYFRPVCRCRLASSSPDTNVDNSHGLLANKRVVRMQVKVEKQTTARQPDEF
jgi:hypothetical protein